ncbi:MAG: repressor LexA [Verrucomicrobia bacterium]|nr:repressor LexA [Verrucomicrobiota bacterium]OQC25943.1 MAG: LexA repressor [Verrucomicrobia bacterium ADurb.Bin063]MBP8015110.1 repressor LexA [Verrucomicrobiota bacterium]MDI9373222.1 transcriptional repressor LexA [Verrucomicrobiota bacterium]HNR70164.1 transcriptional repressor LexA [Verrucomicrobiota bacterium]
MNELTERQQQVLGFIQENQDSAGLTPTLREIAAHFRFNSPNAALAHVQALMAKGFLRNRPGRARSLQVVAPNAPKNRPRPRVVSVPIYGSIPAGRPEDAAQEEEGCVLIDVTTLGIQPTARTFGLKVRGDSMIGKSIVDGDIAIIEHGAPPRPGDVVAALIDGQVTLKTFLRQRGKPYLRAENPRYPNLIPQEELLIQGVMVALIRQRQ